MSNLLTLRYLPISQAELFDGNAKLHDLDRIIESIARYGFKSACKWESTLNNGRGGIVAGNGRVEALREMKRRGDELPIGIAQDETGEWCVPVLFGVEASSEAIARAYALDDNNLNDNNLIRYRSIYFLAHFHPVTHPCKRIECRTSRSH